MPFFVSKFVEVCTNAHTHTQTYLKLPSHFYKVSTQNVKFYGILYTSFTAASTFSNFILWAKFTIPPGNYSYWKCDQQSIAKKSMTPESIAQLITTLSRPLHNKRFHYHKKLLLSALSIGPPTRNTHG